MLKQRVLTAVVLLAILLVALFSGPKWPLAGLLSVFAAAATWEWLRLSMSKRYVRAALPIALLVLAYYLYGAYLQEQAFYLEPGQLSTYWTQPLLLISPAVLAYWFFGVGFLLLMAYVRRRANTLVLSIFGVFAVGVCWLALLHMWYGFGAWYLLSMLALVWVTDTAAYFVGRQWGNRRLAARISPGKTWAGFFGGLAGAVLWVLGTAFFEGSFGAQLVAYWSWLGAVVFTLLLASMSVVGDLFESLLKRRARVKDSSQLLPGHGGVLDRIDALVPVAPLAAFIAGPWHDALFVG